MAENSVRCDDCGFIIGSLTRSAHGNRVEAALGNDSNCKHPPIKDCPSAKAARKKARLQPLYRFH
jgi:hypothetical protein